MGMNEYMVWILLMLGLVPYRFTQLSSSSQCLLDVEAVFWSLRVHMRRRKRDQAGKPWLWACHSCKFNVRLIERMRHAIWVAVTGLRGPRV